MAVLSDPSVLVTDEPDPPGTDLMLGEDGRVHLGDADRRMSGWVLSANCGVAPLRPLSDGETWWRADERRRCETCLDTAAPGR